MRNYGKSSGRWRLATATLFLCGASPATTAGADQKLSIPAPLPLAGRIVAVGIPEAGAIGPVGTFLPGGPIHDLDTPAQPFYRTTQPDQILDPQRIVVASRSNFGAPLARADEQPGAILSIDPRGEPLLIPPTFAQSGDQASAVAGRVRLFTAQSPAFQNSNTPTASTAAELAVSNPLGISINNAFGRLWFANAPTGLAGSGSVTVIDPTGQPLVGAPSPVAGGVFFGALTNRTSLKGLSPGAVGTAMLGPSPDGTTASNAAKTPRVVFAVVTADGAVKQVHVVKGVDDLAPPGTITPLPVAAGYALGGGPGRIGVVWDGMCLFITDPLKNRVVVIMLTADPVSPTAMFHAKFVGTVPLPPGVLATPIDIAPTQPETASKLIASNTSLASGSDMYVANRDNNTIVRIRDDGTVVGVRQVVIPGYAQSDNAGGQGKQDKAKEDKAKQDKSKQDLAWRLNGIGVSSDGQRIWATVIVSGDDSAVAGDGGGIVELPAF
ncbi:MAG: hypothetical protein ACR2IK_11110 [Chloroflexota bacterium]